MNNSIEIVCWNCGGSLSELSLPLLRLDECPDCHAELHVCRMCEFFDPAVAKSCREPVAEEVKDKDRANFCDYFRLVPGAYKPVSAEQAQAAAQLDDLFDHDKENQAAGKPLDELESLFTKPDDEP